MSYLLAKILFLLIVAAVLGAWFMRWWLLHRFSDVTSEYASLTSNWASWRRNVEEQLAHPPEPNMLPIVARMNALDVSIRAIEIPKPVATDLTPVLGAIAGVRIPAPKDVDLSGLYARLNEVEASIRNIPMPVIPPSTTVDLEPLLQKLAALKNRIPVAPPSPPLLPSPSPSSVVRAGSSNLLAHAAYGTPDDLKLIKGVAEALEKMLHGIGVYYFWQIAEWTPTDVTHADAQLTAFHGRISRDDWITQAKTFAARGDAQRRPTSLT